MLTTFIIILAFVAVLWLALALSPFHRAAFAQSLDADTAMTTRAELPSVTVVIPARNEADVLGKTIPTICAQEYPDLRVVVVDDQSEDGSGEVLEKLKREHGNLTVVGGRERPAGWCGKPWAVQQGVEQAKTEWLLFTDADILFHPRAVRQAVSLMLRDDHEMLSLFPQMIFGSWLEKVGIAGLVTMLTLMFPIGKANDPKSKIALAAGGFILIRRSAYEKIGGHAAVKSELIEDVNLARKLKAQGVRVHCRFTKDLVSTRMYESVSDLWEGLAKNAYAGMEYMPHKFWVGLVVGIVVATLPPIYLVVAWWMALRQPTEKHWVAAGLATLVVLCMTWIHSRSVRHMKLPAWHALLMPLSAGFYQMVAVSSAWQHHYRGGNVWKGRRYTREMLCESQKAAADQDAAPSEAGA